MGTRKNKLSLIGIILLVAAVAGAIVAVTGIFLSWFKGTLSSGFMGLEKSMEYGLFGDLSAETDFPLWLVQVIAIAAGVFAVLSAAVTALKAFGAVKIGFLAKILLAALTIALAVLAIIFGFTYVGQFAELNGGDFLKYTWTVGAGGYLTAIGGVVSGAALLLK